MDLANCDRDISRYQKQTKPKRDFFFWSSYLKYVHIARRTEPLLLSQGQCSKWTSAGIKRTPEKLWAVSGHKKLVCRQAVITEDAAFPLPGSLQTAWEHPGNAWGHMYRLTMRRASLSWCCPWRYSCQIPQLSLQQPTRYGKQRPSTGKAGEHGKQP